MKKFDNQDKLQLVGWKLTEANYSAKVQNYLKRLDEAQRNSFAPFEKLMRDSVDGFDLHVMVL